VEDDESVRETTIKILENHGYKVISAEDGIKALKSIKEIIEPIDLVITDVIMPKMSGVDLIKNLKELWPKVKVLYISGYTYDVISKKGLEDTMDHFLYKPFEPKSLLHKLRQALNS
jgi:DNA-binding response OmpR family regulator